MADTAGENAAPRRRAELWMGWLAAAIGLIIVIVVIVAEITHVVSSTGDIVYVVPNAALSPTLASQTVYLPTDAGVYALRASDGRLRWTYPGGIDHTPILTGRAIFGLSLNDGTLYVLSAPSGGARGPTTLGALNASDGAVRWSVETPHFPVARGALVQVGGLLIVTPLGPDIPGAAPSGWNIVAYSATNGAQVWSRALDAAPLASAASSDSGGALYIATTQALIALDATTGAPRWTTGIIPGAYQQGTAPANANTSVALTATSSRVYVLAKRDIAQANDSQAITIEANLYAIDAATGNHIERDGYENEPFSTAFAPAVSGATLIAPVFGGMFASSVGAGRVQWRFTPDGSGAQDQAMTGGALAYGMIYATDLTGVLASENGHTSWMNFTYAVRASDGALMWRAPTNGGLLALTPVVASGVVFAPTATTLKALRASDGRQLWRYITPGAFIGAPVVEA